jgi:formylmethanofuran dehydrogenase subunit E-like metal-binding protein
MNFLIIHLIIKKITMKMQINNNAKRFFLGTLFAAALTVSASAKTSNGTTASTDKVEVKYTGVDVNNQLSFNIKYANVAGNTFNLVVLDENGEQIFKGVYDDKKFDKTFKLPKSETSKVSFVIEDSKASYKEKFDVNVKTRVIEDVIVSRG